MTLIADFLKPLVDHGVSKYSIAKSIGVQPIMISHYLAGKVKSPNFRVCKAIYDKWEVVIFPYTEEELQDSNEQTLMDL